MLCAIMCDHVRFYASVRVTVDVVAGAAEGFAHTCLSIIDWLGQRNCARGAMSTPGGADMRTLNKEAGVVTHLGHRPPSRVAVAKPVLTPIQALI